MHLLIQRPNRSLGYFTGASASPDTLYGSTTPWLHMPDLGLSKDKNILEDVRNFACRLASQQWDSSYQDLLQLHELPSLEEHRLHLKLGIIFSIMQNLCYYPDIPSFWDKYSQKRCSCIPIKVLFAFWFGTYTMLYFEIIFERFLYNYILHVHTIPTYIESTNYDIHTCSVVIFKDSPSPWILNRKVKWPNINRARQFSSMFDTVTSYTTHAAQCTPSQFRCENGQCVSSSFRCNGISDGCSDGSDERGCCKLTC